jgi:hypothetical protein
MVDSKAGIKCHLCVCLRFTSLIPKRLFIQTALEIQGDCRKGLREHTWTVPTTDSQDSI